MMIVVIIIITDLLIIRVCLLNLFLSACICSILVILAMADFFLLSHGESDIIQSRSHFNAKAVRFKPNATCGVDRAVLVTV